MRTLDPVKHDEKRQEILAAATRVIARDGFRGAGTADICKEAGISPGHLYHYFPSKEAILTDLTCAGLEHLAARFADMMQGDDAIGALLAEVGRHKSKKQDAHHRAMGRLMLELLVEAGRNPAIAKVVQKNSAVVLAMLKDFVVSGQLRGQIDPGLDPDLAAGMLLSLVDGMRTMGIRNPDADIGGSLDMLQTLIARFLLPPKKT